VPAARRDLEGVDVITVTKLQDSCGGTPLSKFIFLVAVRLGPRFLEASCKTVKN
jgi:hypothetical protein